MIDPDQPERAVRRLLAGVPHAVVAVSGGPGSGIFKTTDGGATWTELTGNPGLPTGVLGKIGITVSPAKPSRVWAIIEADSGGVYRSDDAGATWTHIERATASCASAPGTTRASTPTRRTPTSSTR